LESRDGKKGEWWWLTCFEVAQKET
jgi:hypothetical protein